VAWGSAFSEAANEVAMTSTASARKRISRNCTLVEEIAGEHRGGSMIPRAAEPSRHAR